MVNPEGPVVWPADVMAPMAFWTVLVALLMKGHRISHPNDTPPPPQCVSSVLHHELHDQYTLEVHYTALRYSTLQIVCVLIVPSGY